MMRVDNQLLFVWWDVTTVPVASLLKEFVYARRTIALVDDIE